MGDGVIGSPPAFGAGKSRFESESPSNDRRPRPRRSVSQPLLPAAAREGGIAAVVVLAAGQGTRMRSSTPKVLHALGGRSMLGHVLVATAPLAPPHTLVGVGAGREAVEEHLAQVPPGGRPDRKRTRLNSSHANISHAG